VTKPAPTLLASTRQGYKLTVADLERLHRYDQEAGQSSSDELGDDELSEQELELVAGGCGFKPPKPPGPPWQWGPLRRPYFGPHSYKRG